MRRTALGWMFAAGVLWFPATPRAAAEPATLVVDRDRVECGNAGFTSIQAAVDAAQPGDLIRVCPDVYTEMVVVDKPLTLQADPDAVEAIDCFQPTLGELPADQQAIVDPAGDGFSIAFKLEADHVELSGFVIQGASVGIDASDRFSGYRVHHNLIRLNTLFGVDFGSEGTRESRVDHNCLRENTWALVSELDDDSVWKPSDGPERELWNARDLRNARIDHNMTFRNDASGLEAVGPGRRVRVTIDHNVVRQDAGGILLQNATASAIVGNEISESPGNAILIGGATDHLVIAGNHVRGTPPFRGIGFLAVGWLDLFPVPDRDVVVTHNDVRGAGVGIVLGTGTLVDSLISENTASENRGNGILVQPGNTGNMIRGNVADDNGTAVHAGITAALGATGNRFEQNSMHGNYQVDARDFNPLLDGMLQNTWTRNDCDTDFPAGMICGVG